MFKLMLPEESAVVRACPWPGKNTETDSAGTKPTPLTTTDVPTVNVEGVTNSPGTTVTGPGPTLPLVRPTPYIMWTPPGSGVGKVMFLPCQLPFEVVVTVASTVPDAESRWMSTDSLAPNPPPWTRT